MQLGRFRTWVNAVLKRPALRRARAQAWKIYGALSARLTFTWPDRPSDKLGRFAHHIVDCGLPRPIRYLEIGASKATRLPSCTPCSKARCASP
jgi:hypothetical protein